MKFDKEKMRLYAITDRHWLNGRSLKEVVKESLDGGVTFLQLRDKNSDDETESQNTRMYDIFNLYGLSHKIYFPSSSESWQLPIDYSKVTPIMELEIENSIKFLEYSINN